MDKEIRTVRELEKELSDLSSKAGATCIGGMLDPYWERAFRRLNEEFHKKYDPKKEKNKVLDDIIMKTYKDFCKNHGEARGYINGPNSMYIGERPIVVFLYGQPSLGRHEISEGLEKYELQNHMFLYYTFKIRDLRSISKNDIMFDYSPIILTQNINKERIKKHLPECPTVIINNKIDYGKLAQNLIEIFFDREFRKHTRFYDCPDELVSILGSKKAAKSFILDELNKFFKIVFPSVEFKEGYPSILRSLKEKHEKKINYQFARKRPV
jgi:hypothetical protein